MNRAEEDYLKTIYELTIEQNIDVVKIQDLSNKLSLTNQTVNEMIKKIASKDMVEYLPYKGVNLTNKGKKIAEKMLRSHRVWEVFLTEKLGFNWREVHQDAEALEHSTSEKVVDALYEYLGKPEYCFHGNPIPLKNGGIPKLTHKRISDLKPGERFKIVRVIDDEDLLEFLDKMKIRLNDEFILKNTNAALGIYEIEGKASISLNDMISKMIFIEEL